MYMEQAQANRVILLKCINIILHYPCILWDSTYHVVDNQCVHNHCITTIFNSAEKLPTHHLSLHHLTLGNVATVVMQLVT